MKGSNPIKIHILNRAGRKGFVNIKITAMTFGDGQMRTGKSPFRVCPTASEIPPPRWGRARVGVEEVQYILQLQWFPPPLIPSHQGRGNELLDRLTEGIFSACIREAFHRCSLSVQMIQSPGSKPAGLQRLSSGMRRIGDFRVDFDSARFRPRAQHTGTIAYGSRSLFPVHRKVAPLLQCSLARRRSRKTIKPSLPRRRESR